MALTGFDPSLVTNSIGKVKSAYSDLIAVLGNEMQDKFVSGMQDKWACTQAQTFFTDDLKPAIDQLISDSTNTFESVVNAMDSAAANWATSTDTSYTKVGFSAITKTINVDSIVENINGVRGIDVAEAGTVAALLPGIAENAKSALSSAQNAVEGCGFVNGSQEESLVNSLATISNSIDSAFSSITTQVKSAIDNTVSVYSDLEGKVSAAFSGQA
jgi:hypothetical protein